MTTETTTAIRDDLSSLNMNALRKRIKAERFAKGEEAWPTAYDAIDDLNALKDAHRAWRAERTVPKHVSTIPANGDPIGAPMYAHERESGDSSPSNDTIDLHVLPMTQLGRECFVAAWPYRFISRITVDREVQRDLAKKRVPEIAEYVKSADGYFNAAMVTVGGDGDAVVYIDGRLTIEPNATVVVNDGQHRIAGIRRAMEDEEFAKEHAEDSLPVVIYTDLTMREQRQAFADINKNAAKPNRATSLDYDERDFISGFAKRLIAKSIFNGHIAYRKQKLGKNDSEWFTFAAIVDTLKPPKPMFDDLTPANADQRLIEAVAFWSSAGDAMIGHWEAKNYATNKNALVAIARLYGFDVDWTKLRDLDWSLDGEMARIGAAGGGSNGAVTALYEHLSMECVRA
jgi:DGQHR domain-containing protein